MEKVFAVVANPANDPLWQLDVLRAQPADHVVLQTGTTFPCTLRERDGSASETSCTVTWVEPNRLLEIELVHHPARRVITYVIERDAGATHFRRCVVVETGLPPARERLLRTDVLEGNRQCLERLKALLEGTPAAALTVEDVGYGRR